MDRGKFVSEIEALLYDSGAVKELQTKLRSDLIQVLLRKNNNPSANISKDIGDDDKAGILDILFFI
jgi:hypothetical protein